MHRLRLINDKMTEITHIRDLTAPEALNAVWGMLTVIASHDDDPNICDCANCRWAIQTARACLAVIETATNQVIKHIWNPMLIGTGGGLIFLSNCERTVLGGRALKLIACAMLS